MNFAPIVLFVYNRPEHTHQTVESLKNNFLANQSELFIFSDGPRSDKDKINVAKVRAIIDTLDGFKKITIAKSESNKGLANSVIAGVSEVIKHYGKAIVVEDDLQFSPYFLNYMNDALNIYKNDKRVYSIGGYSPHLEIPQNYIHDSYLSYRCCTWGWATWQDRWEKVDWSVKDYETFINDPKQVARFNRGGEDMSQIFKLQMAGKVNSWGIRWDYAHFKNEAYCFRPTYSIVTNNGHDGSGVHCAPTDMFDVSINLQSKFNFPSTVKLNINEEINLKFASFYDGKPRATSIATASKQKMYTYPLQLIQKILFKIRKTI